VARNASPETGARQAGQQKRDADDVNDVVHVEAVSRALDAANTRERTVEAVAKPVDGQGPYNHPEPAAVPTREPEPETRQHHRRQRQSGQMVRVNGRRQMAGHSNEQPLFGRRQKTPMFTHVLGHEITFLPSNVQKVDRSAQRRIQG